MKLNKIFLGLLCLAGSIGSAQEVTINQPKLFCLVDQFSLGLNKASTPAFSKCASLKDAKDEPIKSLEECKAKALERGKSCLTKMGIDKLAVRGKFTEKFDIRSQSTNFTCELDKGGGSSCP